MNITILKKTSRQILAITLTLLATIPHTWAGTSLVVSDGKTEVVAMESEPGLRAFVEAYLAAQNARDVEKLKGFYHPADLAACAAFLARQPAVAGQPKPTLETLLLRAPIPRDHPPFLVQRYLKDSPLPQAGFRDWPVPPTHLVQSSYETSPNNTSTFLLHAIRVDDRWFAVEGVPNADFIKKIHSGM